VQGLAAGVLEHQHGPTAVADELDRPRRPCPVELVLQVVFASKAIEGGRCRMFRGGQHGQHGGPITIDVASAEDAFVVLPQDLESIASIGAEPRQWIHLPDPPSGGRHWGRPEKGEDRKVYHARGGKTTPLTGAGLRNRPLLNRKPLTQG